MVDNLLLDPQNTFEFNNNHLFRRLLSAAKIPTCNRSKKVLREIGKEWVKEWAGLVLQNQEALKRLASHSVWHPNGFIKIIAGQSKTGERIRLHIWPKANKAKVLEDIHDHYWRFSSLILLGQLQEDSFKMIGGKQGIKFSVQELNDFQLNPQLGKKYEFQKKNTTNLALDSRRYLCKEELYCAGQSAIHRVKNLGKEVAATLVLQGRPIKDSTRIFRTLGKCKNGRENYKRPISSYTLTNFLVLLQNQV